MSTRGCGRGYLLWRVVAPFVVLAALGGCARYHPRPLSPKIASAALRYPSIPSLEVAAARVRHPILRPVTFNGGRLTPDQIAVLAVVANPGLRAVRDQAQLAHAQLIQAGLLPNPVFSYGVSLPMGNTAGLTRGYSFGLGLDLRALLLRNSRKAVARANIHSVALNVAWQEWQVAEGAKLHALRLISLRGAVRTAVAIANDAAHEARVMRLALAAHEATLFEEEAAADAAQKARMAVIRLKAEQARERLALNQAIGLAPTVRLPLERRLHTARWRTLPKLAAVLAHLQQRRLDLVALRYGYESAEERLRQQVLAQFPRILLSLARARDTTDVNSINSGVSIGLPIFNHNQGRIAIASATRRQLFDEYVARLFASRAQAAQILSDMKWVKRRIRDAEAGVRSSARLERAAKQAFAHGDMNIIVYYGIREQFASQRLALTGLMRRLDDLGVALEVASGRYFEGVRRHR
ncbi:MAG: TolC family protein [Acidiferrobacteraceae bacterium]